MGVGGLLPFVGLSPGTRPFLEDACALLPPAVGDLIVQHADALLVSYGVSIASFLGGVYWGAAMSAPAAATAARGLTARLVWGVAPSVASFPAVLIPAPWDMVYLANALLVMLHADMYYAVKGLYPRRLMALRLPLTLVAIASLMVAVEAAEARDGTQSVQGLRERILSDAERDGTSVVYADRDAADKGWVNPAGFVTSRGGWGGEGPRGDK